MKSIDTVGSQEEQYETILHSDPCCYCGEVAVRSVEQQVDHIIPRHRGGSDVWDNLTASCSRCNQSKGKKLLLLFMLERVQENAPPPQPMKGVRWRKDTKRWDARIHGVNGKTVLLGSFITSEQAVQAVNEWHTQHPDLTPIRLQQRSEREARIKEMWHAGASVKTIASELEITDKAVAGQLQRMRERGEDVMTIGRGAPGRSRSLHPMATSGAKGYRHTPGYRMPWLVQVQQGTRKLRARFATEDEAIAAVAEFRARMLEYGPKPRNALEHARRARGLSQKQLGELVGMTNAAISSLESGRTQKPHRKTREAIAKALDMDAETLFSEMRDFVEPKPSEPLKGRPDPTITQDETYPGRPWLVQIRYSTIEAAQAAMELLRRHGN